MKAFFLSAALLSLTLASCDKDTNSPADTAGKGGSTNLRVAVNYRGTGIDSGRVRIRYNATTAPANPLLWDDSADIQRLNNTVSQALFTNLKKGQYYLEANAYQPLSTPGQKLRLKGGFSYLMTDTGVVEVVLPVTEQP